MHQKFDIHSIQIEDGNNIEKLPVSQLLDEKQQEYAKELLF